MTKELAFRHAVIAEFPNQQMQMQTQVQDVFVDSVSPVTHVWGFNHSVGGCSRRRPDMYIDLVSHVLIIEIDENQHASYSTPCDTNRNNELYEDFACRPLVFLRLNPDRYVTTSRLLQTGGVVEKHGGCFTQTRSGLVVAHRPFVIQTRARLLFEHIREWLVRVPATTTIVQLCYSESL